MAVDDDEELTVDDLDELEDDADADNAAAPTPESETESELPADEDGDPPWGPTITVNDTTYAVSLFWQPLQDTDDPYPEVKETVDNFMEGADLFCLRSGTSPQYGIGNSTEGHKAGMPSAAAALADTFRDKPSSVAVFEVDEGWWFIAIRNDLILSEEDLLYLNEEDAKRAFFAMMAVPDWGRKIAPASWEIEGTEEVDLWDLLKSPGGSKLMHINNAQRQKIKLIAIGAAVVLAFVLYKAVISPLFFTTAKPVIRPLAPMKPLFEEEAPPPPPEIVVKPWEKLMVPEDFMNRCQAAVQQLKSMIIPGWDLEPMTCTPSGVSTGWTMRQGHLGWFKRAIEEYNTRGLDYLLDETGKSAVATLAIGDIAVHHEEPKYEYADLHEELTDIFQAIKMEISMEQIPIQREIPRDADGNPAGPPRVTVYPRLTFSFTSDLPMDYWLDMFKKFPGLEVLQLSYTPGDNTWTYEGQIYEPVM